MFVFGLLLLLFLIVFIITCYGLINPLIFLKYDLVLTRVQIFFTGCLVNFFIICFMAFVAEPPPPSSNKSDNITAQQPQSFKEEPWGEVVEAPLSKKNEPIKIESNLGIKPEEFRKKFNAQLKNLEITTVRPVAEFDMYKGEVRDTFQVYFTDSLGLNGVVNKDGTLRELTYIVGATRDYENAMMDLLIVTGVTARVLNPNNDNAPPQIVELINVTLENVGKEKNVHHAIVGNNRYYAMANEAIGLWVGFAPAKE